MSMSIIQSTTSTQLSNIFQSVHGRSVNKEFDGAYRATLVNAQDELVGQMGVMRVSDTMGYVCYAEVAEKLDGLLVEVESNQLNPNFCQMKITREEKQPSKYESSPMYAVHETKGCRYPLQHLYDQAAVSAIGALNLEFSKNITVDLPLTANFGFWRDALGFIVRDSTRFYLIRVKSSDLLALCPKADNNATAATNYTVVKATEPATFNKYDKFVHKQSRKEFNGTLFKNSAVQLYEVKLGVRTVGTMGVLPKNGTVLFLYADDEVITQLLLTEIASRMPDVSICLPETSWLMKKAKGGDVNLLSDANVYQRVHNTRISSHINWDKVVASNIFNHIV